MLFKKALNNKKLCQEDAGEINSRLGPGMAKPGNNGQENPCGGLLVQYNI